MRTSDDRAGEWWPPLAARRLRRLATGPEVTESEGGALLLPLLLFATCLGGLWWDLFWAWLPVLVSCFVAGVAWQALSRRQIVGWQVSDRGLRAVRRGQAATVYPWGRVQRVGATARFIEVETSGGTLRIPRRGRHSQEMEQYIRDRIATPAPELAQSIDASQIAIWLGIDEDGATTFSPPGPGCGSTFVAAYCLITFLMAASIGFRFTGPMLGPPVLILLFTLWRRRTPSLTVSATGFRRGDELLAAWDDVQSIERGGGYDIVYTDRGEIRFPAHAPNAAQVRHAVVLAMEAKASGAMLPRLSDIPDTALSRAEPDSVSAERGLSQPE